MKRSKEKKIVGIAVLVFALMLALTSVFAACKNNSTSSGSGSDSGDDSSGGGSSGPATVTELTIETPPDVTEYYAGEAFDPTGMELKARWSDGLRVSVDIDDCTISPAGPLTVEDSEVTITYEGASVEQEITVLDISISSIVVDTGNIALKASVNTPMDFSGITVTAKYADGNERVLEGGYTFEVDGEPVTDVSALTFAEWGEHTLTVVYGDKKADITLDIFDGFIVEAENIIKSPVETDKNYVEIYKASSSGTPGGKFNDNEPASGGGYMGSVFNGSVIRFHVYAEEACNADVILRASSAYMLKDGGSWDPIEMGDQQFNRLFDVSYGTAAEAESGTLKELVIPDDVVLEGGATDNPTGDRMLYVNWKDVNFGTLALKEGDNVIELNVITDYVNCKGENVACNIDRLEIQYTEDAPDETLTAKSLQITQAPNKTAYVAGETFDPTGMVVEATMSDDSKRTVSVEELEISPAGPLTADTTEITVSWKGVSATQTITVVESSGQTIEFEAENLKTPADGERYYTESIRSGYQGAPGVKASEAPDTADTSGGKYLNGLFGDRGNGGAIVRFHIWSDTACKAEIKIYASSCNITVRGTDGTSNWRPSEMGDVQFNEIFAVRFGADAEELSVVSVADDVIVEGGKSADGKTDMALWENWREISLGEFDLVAGDNILELENINSTLTNLAGETYGMNIDRVAVKFA